jgi:hypothetical protein
MAPSESEDKMRVFCSCPHDHSALRDELTKHLTSLPESRRISLWNDSSLRTGGGRRLHEHTANLRGEVMAVAMKRSVWLVLLTALAVPSQAFAQETIAAPQRSTPVSAYGGSVAWSEYDRASGRYTLMRRVRGETAAVPVPTRGVPFDVDLGPDAHGNVTAVYSRCRIEPGRGDPAVRQWAAGTPQWSSGRGCDLYRFTFAGGRETRISAASTPDASEFLPTISGRYVAFARVYTRRSGRRGKRTYLYRRTIAASGRSRRLPAPPRAEQPRVEPGPSALDLVGNRLVLAWETYRQGPISEIDLVTLGHGRRVIERVGSGEIQTVNLLSPTLHDGWVHYGQGQYGDSTDGYVRRYRIRTGRAQQSSVSSDGMLLATAADASATYALISGGYDPGCSTKIRSDPSGAVVTGPCRLARLASIPWEPYRPHRFRLPPR